MGDFSKNPKRPVEVKVPNKIRKHIAMHETDRAFYRRRIVAATTRLRKALALRPVPVVQKKGSLWSRFTDGVKVFIKYKTPEGRLR